VDGSLTTRWSGSGDGAWIRYDLGAPQSVAYVKIAVYNGNTRQNRFDLQVSGDGASWSTVLPGALSNGTTTGLQTHDFADVTARYVRYLGHGNTVNTFNSLSEVEIWGTPCTSCPTPTPTATSTATPTATATSTPTATPTSGGPTTGWTQKSWTYVVHKPFVLPLSDRFQYTNGVWYTWVYKTDWCMHETCGSNEGKRTELRWGNDYSSGSRMWDSDMWIWGGTHEATVQQIFGAVGSATTSQIRAFMDDGGTLKRYGSETLVTGINNTWVNVKVAHDTGANTVKHYINNVLKLTSADRGDTTHYFKNGVYVGAISSARSEARFRNTTQWAK